MAEPLSDAWIAALDNAAAEHPGLQEAAAAMALVLEYSTSGGPSWHVVFDHGSVRVVAGPADHPDLRFATDPATARALAAGTLDPLRAVIDGDLTLVGDPRLLVEHRAVFDDLGDVFAIAREP
ncbi:MAG: SCP2 sterol-binding domain-containing protein [Acidimicrobiales bacterium]|nr:SCP2 sterol-binding domain-containing protein [Acidimicrobiales bacterium]